MWIGALGQDILRIPAKKVTRVEVNPVTSVADCHWRYIWFTCCLASRSAIGLIRVLYEVYMKERPIISSLV